MADHVEETQASGAGSTAAQPGSGGAWLWLLLTLLFGATYMLVLDIPFLRESGLPAVVLMPIAMFVTLRHAYQRPVLARIVPAVLATAITSIFFIGVFGPLIPKPEAAAAKGTLVADMTLPDQEGTPQTLSTMWKQGPLLLVFYRGHW